MKFMHKRNPLATQQVNFISFYKSLSMSTKEYATENIGKKSKHRIKIFTSGAKLIDHQRNQFSSPP